MNPGCWGVWILMRFSRPWLLRARYRAHIPGTTLWAALTDSSAILSLATCRGREREGAAEGGCKEKVFAPAAGQGGASGGQRLAAVSQASRICQGVSALVLARPYP